ncbi:unnamed protein product [Adineta ricciae]|uniref:F-box domain-containing protein n=1 Tax=Adineta ricciae TaxID=249248 RepID=A0A814TRH0_ADIRI|nr:unnamed protein product [Adineta ricciae]CAF1164868.1 unnamed protein product [Adineta ricciae]
MVLFECLPNEVLLESFIYLDTIQLLRALYGLNVRLNRVIYLHFEAHQFSFQSLPNEHFDLICHEYLPCAIENIRSLRLSHEETPDLSEILFSQYFTLDRFHRLQTLCLHYIKSLGTLMKITYQCRNLQFLTTLKIIADRHGEKQTRIFNLFDNIWNIPSLKHCNLNGIQKKLIVPFQMSSVSSTIEFLCIQNVKYGLQALFGLLLCTPNLEHLSTTIGSYTANDYLELQSYTMTSLFVSFDVFPSTMKIIFEKFPNLQHLKVKINNTYIDGSEWQQIIETHLPRLKLFQFKMIFEFMPNIKRDVQAEQILQTFRSPFWIEKHQWFVRCRWNPSNTIKLTIVYTLPYAFESFHYSNEYCERSTDLAEKSHRVYEHIRYVHLHRIDAIDSVNDLNPFNIKFPKTIHVTAHIPFDNTFLYSNQTFNEVKSLVVYLSMDTGYYQLQLLIDQMPALYSLKIYSHNRVHASFFHLTSRSVRRLDLTRCSLDGVDYLSDEECRRLIDSPMGKQCEVLFAPLSSRDFVLDLIHKMATLRLLVLECYEDPKIFKYCKCKNDELLEWLHHQLLTTCLIVRDQTSPSKIKIWINREDLISNCDIIVPKDRGKILRSIRSTFPRLFRKSSFYQ